MASVRLNGDTSGFIEISAPSVAGSTTITLPATSGGDFLVTDSNGDLNVDSGTLFVDASTNRVGIGTTSPERLLHVFASDTSITSNSSSTLVLERNGVNVLNILKPDGTAGIIGFSGNSTNADGRITYDNTSSRAMEFWTASQERARIDSSGRLLVGTSSAAANGTYAQYGITQFEGNSNNNSGAAIVVLRRGEAPSNITNNEDLGVLTFSANDGQEFATIRGVADGAAGASDFPGRLAFSTTENSASSPTERFRVRNNGEVVVFNSPTFYPNTDNAVELGFTGNRWSKVWAVNGTIQTSDERQKIEITESALGTEFVKSLRPVSYKWIEGGKRPTGEYDEDNNCIYESVPGQRTHWGFIAQEVKQAVDDAGVDFGGWVLTDKDDPDSEQALRYDQFIAPLTKALQEALAKIETLETANASLEARLTALEGGN